MKKWLMAALTFVLVLGSVTYVYASRLNVTHQITITDQGITPATIQVQENEVVKIVVVNKGSKKHNLVIPDYYIFLQNLNVGESTDAEFTANKKGKFPYYSDTPGTPEPGLRGNLIVQ